MTQLLQKAYSQIAQLPESEQDAIAAMIIEELESDERWQRSFAASQDALANLAAEAMAEFRDGKTQPLNPDDL